MTIDSVMLSVSEKLSSSRVGVIIEVALFTPLYLVHELVYYFIVANFYFGSNIFPPDILQDLNKLLPPPTSNLTSCEKLADEVNSLSGFLLLARGLVIFWAALFFYLLITSEILIKFPRYKLISAVASASF